MGKIIINFRESEETTATHQGLSNITGLISKLSEVKVKNSLGTMKDNIFSLA